MRISSHWRCRSIRIVVVVTAVFLFLISLMSNFSFSSDESSSYLKRQIVDLSEKYVKKLAEEQANLVDHPYNNENTHYDLKKTFAVLIESILGRLSRIESLLNRTGLEVLLQRSSDNGTSLHAEAIIAGAQEKCQLPLNWKIQYPDCEAKLKWMQTFWKSDPCYGRYGVDGSLCSFIIYLSEVETFCPRYPWRKPPVPTEAPSDYATGKSDVTELLSSMKDNPTNFEWIKQRIIRMWPVWRNAYGNLASKQNWTLNTRSRKKVLLHLGFLTKESGFKFGEKSLKGGPLGELVQWSDLIASLFALGHNLQISSEISTFVSFAQADPALKSSCPVLSEKHVDVIYTDIVGLRQMKKKIPASLQNYKCRLRVLDSFGTHAEFNHQPFFLKHKTELGAKTRNVWGAHGLNLQQFYNMYPHTPDNSFLGFVVERHINESDPVDSDFTKRPWALVYGKELYMWKDKENYLSWAKDLVEIHATVNAKQEDLPKYVVNHGVLSGKDLHSLLRKCKIFLGLGFPYEGPAPLEAVANGAIFINPLFRIPKGRLSEKFFNEKPTLRSLTSQNPYAQDFIGSPHVLTIDIENQTAVIEAIQTALKTEVQPYLPYEFTAEGLMERVNAFIEHQDFCSATTNWPPFSASHNVLSKVGQSCKDACFNEGFVCERSYFPKINDMNFLKRFTSIICAKSSSVEETYAPSYDSNAQSCYLQAEPMLFSCSTRHPNMERLCPCRDFIKDQVALCAACL